MTLSYRDKLVFIYNLVSVSFFKFMKCMSLNKVIRQGEQVKYLENLSSKHEKTISSLEEDIVLLLQVSRIYTYCSQYFVFCLR